MVDMCKYAGSHLDKLNADNSTVIHEYFNDYHTTSFTCLECSFSIVKRYMFNNKDFYKMDSRGNIVYRGGSYIDHHNDTL